MAMRSYRTRSRVHHEDIADGWDVQVWNPDAMTLEALDHIAEHYSPEDALFDALDDLPTRPQVTKLIELLRHKELKEVTEGVLNDCSQAAKTLQPLEYANTINSWVATAEEIIANRRTYRYIMAAKDRGNPQRESR